MVNYTLRVGASLRDAFYSTCKAKGLTPGTVIRLFALRAVNGDELPLKFSDYEDSGGECRIGFKIDSEILERLSDICSSLGFSLSTIIRCYMNYCVVGGDEALNSFLVNRKGGQS